MVNDKHYENHVFVQIPLFILSFHTKSEPYKAENVDMYVFAYVCLFTFSFCILFSSWFISSKSVLLIAKYKMLLHKHFLFDLKLGFKGEKGIFQYFPKSKIFDVIEA